MLSSPFSAPDASRELDSLMEAAGDVVLRLNTRAEIIHISRRGAEILLFDNQRSPHDKNEVQLAARQSLHGKAFSQLLHEEEQDVFQAALVAAIGQGRSDRVDVRISTPEQYLWLELQLAVYLNRESTLEILAVGRDISAQKATEERLRHMATHDALTGLPNRLLLSDRLRMTIARAKRSNQGFAVAMLDLDGFKKVNDVLGHPVGDDLLRVATMRLAKALRDSDTLARVGGDEFVALLPGATSEAEIKIISGRLIAAVQSPFEVDGHTIYIGASVGVALYPEHGDDEVKLLAHADSALYRAKETGKARCVIYSPQQSPPPEHDITLEAAMFHAVREGEFLLYYQPIVDAQTRQIQGFETLMRWLHPNLGMVSPLHFVPLAEANGLINLLGAWALKSACMQLKSFEEVAKRPLYISVNVSPRQFRNDQFLRVLDEAIAYSGIPGEKVLLEITEGTLMIDPEHAQLVLNNMIARAVRIAIDDFGTGYSSLAYLKRFPISVLKIDRAFIKDLPASTKDAAICHAVLDLAKHLDLAVVAEGIESELQMSFMSERGCQYVQGYLTGKPMPPHVALEALKEKTYASILTSMGRPT
ncbi:EAL domain-containing protein [Massilia sp. W12]|uniref:putative bifunctional diguanylate cyclase/phosphodiesterase n=1 Tax=Massilia sp. W12 TaxID=3126507 RepID=UPI0030D308A9